MTNYKLNGIEISPEQQKEIHDFYEKNKSEVPQEGQGVFTVGLSFEIFITTFSKSIENSFYAGEIFLTREEAERKVEKLKALAKINKYIHDNGLKFTPDWGSEYETKWTIDGWNYIYDTPEFDAYNKLNDSCYGLVFKSKKDLQLVLDNCKEELEILLKD